MQLLITRSQLQQYKQVSNTPHDDKLNEQIRDAQLLDLQPILGENLYNKILADTASYTALLDGGTYEYEGVTYTNYGLRMVLSYFAYARYIYFGSQIDTPFSLVEKLNDNSRPVEQPQKKTIYQMNRDAAYQLWLNVENYLIRTNNADFKTCKPKKSGFRINKIQ